MQERYYILDRNERSLISKTQFYMIDLWHQGGQGGRRRPGGGREEEHGQGDAAGLRERRERRGRLHLVDLLLQPAGAGGRQRGADRGLGEEDDARVMPACLFRFMTPTRFNPEKQPISPA